jgi:uncharacterized protein YbjT (DUF2867 family)
MLPRVARADVAPMAATVFRLPANRGGTLSSTAPFVSLTAQALFRNGN